MRKTAMRVEPTKTRSKSSVPAAVKSAAKGSQRTVAYLKHFQTMAEPVDSEKFFKQVNGYTTPVYSQVSSFAGV